MPARFIGRKRALEEIAAKINVRGERLITILGPPGIGKTRLAARFGEGHEGQHASSASFFCDLTGARTAADICASVARTMKLHLRNESGGDAVDFIARALAEAGPLLLILDNVEQVVTDAATVIEQWSAIAPEAVLVVTSRARLGLANESVLDLMPLEPNDAVSLYEERARSVGGWDDTDPRALEHVTAIVKALEGIPLAIELAAARSRVLSAEKIFARLTKVLESGKALRAAIDTSWELLSPIEQSTLAQCSIFAGDFSIEAAEAVLKVDDDVVEVLAALLDKSLIKSSPNKRFSLYASIRDYAAEHVPTEELAPLVVRHRRYFIDSTRDAVNRLTRTGDPSARLVIVQEKENLIAAERALAAVATIRGAQENEDLARVVLHLEPLIAVESGFEDLVATLTRAIEAARASRHPELEGPLLIARGAAYGIRGRSNASLEDVEAARDIGHALGDAALEAEGMIMASVRYRHQGRFEDARRAGENALAILAKAKSSGGATADESPRVLGACHAVLGLLLCELGEVEASRRENLQARAIFFAAGDRWSEALALANLAQLDQASGDYEKSAHGYDGALERFREHGDRRYESRYLGYRAGLELERGDVASARATYAASIELLSLLRIRPTEALFRACHAALAHNTREEIMNELNLADNLIGSVSEDAAPSVKAAIEIHHGHLDVLLAREAKLRAEEERASRFIDLARARLNGAQAKELATKSEDVRFALRVLTRAIAKYEARFEATAVPVVPSIAPPPMPGATTLTLGGPKATWFRAFGPTGETVDLGRRASFRLLLIALADAHTKSPGTALSWETLLAAGWPGEKVLASAGSTRVRVAISTLRRLGLTRMLITRNDGYLLDPTTILEGFNKD